jgi:hypothetical protein
MICRTIASSEQEAASTPVLIVETVSRCLLSLTQAFGSRNPPMLSRRYFYAALALALLAVAMQMGAMRYRAEALSIRVRAIRAEQPIDSRAAAQIENYARLMSAGGLVCCGASIGNQ